MSGACRVSCVSSRAYRMSRAHRMSRAYPTSLANRSQSSIFTQKNRLMFNMCNTYLNWRGQKLTVLQPQFDSGE